MQRERLEAMKAVVKGRRARGVAVIVLAASLSACAAPRQQAAAPLDEAARTVMEQTTQQVLEEGQDGQGFNWSIAETGHAGNIIPTRTYQSSSGQTCREFQQTVTVGGTTQIANGTACRKTEGGWQRVDYTGLADIRSHRPAYRYPSYGYAPYYGYRPYYPQTGFGIFFGHGGHYRHRHHGHRHHKKHHGHSGGRRNPDR